MIKNARTLGLILLLTVLFIFDDILIYFLLKNLYDWQVGLPTLTIGSVIVLGLNVGLALTVFKIMQRRPTTGEAGMIGKSGIVLKKLKGEYLVKVKGEIWKSQSGEKLKVGDRVIIENVAGLNLQVKKYQ